MNGDAIPDAIDALEDFKTKKAAFFARQGVHLAEVHAAAENYRAIVAFKKRAEPKRYRHLRVPSVAELMR